jgi:hypothetical protein
MAAAKLSASCLAPLSYVEHCLCALLFLLLLQAFGCYMHMSVIRLFVESILRYGLPPQFQAAVVKPLPKMEARLRTALAANFGTGECCCTAVLAQRWHSYTQ